MQDYFNKQQLDKMYNAAGKALALNPDDVTVLGFGRLGNSAQYTIPMSMERSAC